MKKEKTKPTKRKILTYYLILAASLLVIAAITVGIVFGVRNSRDMSIDKGQTEKPNDDDNKGNNDDNKKPDDDKNQGNNDDDTNKPVDGTTAFEFVVPLKTNVDLAKAHVFGYDKTLDRYCLHQAMDFAAAAGTEVIAAVDGTVTEVSTSDVLYGAVIRIAHANGVETVYKFIDPVSEIKVGDKVNRGQVIGTVSVANGVENADGEHLHFEVFKDSELVDPDDYLKLNTK